MGELCLISSYYNYVTPRNFRNHWKKLNIEMNYCKARKELFCCLICSYYVIIICYYLGITLVCILNFCSISLPLIPHLHKNVTFYSPQQSLAVLFFRNYVSTSYFFLAIYSPWQRLKSGCWLGIGQSNSHETIWVWKKQFWRLSSSQSGSYSFREFPALQQWWVRPSVYAITVFCISELCLCNIYEVQWHYLEN